MAQQKIIQVSLKKMTSYDHEVWTECNTEPNNSISQKGKEKEKELDDPSAGNITAPLALKRQQSGKH